MQALFFGWEGGRVDGVLRGHVDLETSQDRFRVWNWIVDIDL